uniref:MAGE domain-containing protein n=1 Tax=Plectus sambesii TaxID=2011161 RepID=A0A914ULM0_9BILA
MSSNRRSAATGPRRTSYGAQVMRGEASTSGATRRRRRSSSSSNEDDHRQVVIGRAEMMDRQPRADAPQDQQINERELDEQAAEMVHVLLALHDKKGVIRDADIKKAVPRLTAGAARRNLIKEAGRRLYRSFGLRLVQEEEHQDRYFLQNAIVSEDPVDDDNDVVGFDLSRMDEAKRGLLYTVLMFLFMSKNPQLKSANVTEDELWRFLRILYPHAARDSRNVLLHEAVVDRLLPMHTAL